MAEREGPGPFAAGPIVQGDANDAGGLTDDVVSYSRGSQIGANFYTNVDSDQGSVVLWWTPEYGAAQLAGGGDHYILRMLSYEYDTDAFTLTVNDQSMTVAFPGLAAGTTYNLVARWDTRSTLDGTNYASLSIDDAHNFGITTAPSPFVPPATFYVGSDGTSGAASGIIEGLTYYRRPLYDGANGTDVGNGDEINLIDNAGSGDDPTRITGSWDVVFALPTDGTTGVLTAGTGSAWSHPHSSNLLGGTGTGGFLLGATPAADGWVQEGTPSGINPLAASEKIFAGGFKITSSGTADEGMRHDVAVSAGEDWVARVLVHSDGTCQPKVELYDQTNGSAIDSLTGTTSSTRTAPNALILTGEAPSGSTTLRLKLVNAVANGTCHWHQAEVLTNDLTNPSFEGGSNAGGLWIPTGWANDVNNPLGTGDTKREKGTVHSGSDAVLFSHSGVFIIGWFNVISPVVTGKFYSVGAYANGGPQEIYIRERARSQFQALAPAASASTNGTDGPVSPVGWTLYPSVLRAAGVGHNFVGFGFRGSTGGGGVDDVYRFVLADVALSVTPASFANSVENTTEVRVDGRDQWLIPDTGGSTTSGVISFGWRPRHSAAQATNFVENAASPIASVVTLYGDASNSIQIFWGVAPNTLQMAAVVAGSLHGGSWDATGAIVAGTQYAIQFVLRRPRDSHPQGRRGGPDYRHHRRHGLRHRPDPGLSRFQRCGCQSGRRHL